MDISEYWKTAKAQSKALTGVAKLDSGVFHSSGIASSLEAYIKAVKGGKQAQIAKAAAVAYKKCNEYVTKIHKKEIMSAQGKKAMSQQQLKSAKIVGDALDKILEQLAAVISGQAVAGSFDGDAVQDAAASSDKPDRILGQKAQAHIDLRNKVEKDAKKFLASYKAKAAPVANFLKIGQKSAADAQTTKKAGDTFNNIQAISNAQRASDEIASILKQIQDHYDANISSSGTDFMKGRMDFAGKDELPAKFRVTYMKEHNAAWGRVMTQANAINKLIVKIKASLEAANKFQDIAESNSLQAIDPSKLIAKLSAIETAADKAFKDTELARTRVLNVEENVRNIMTSSLDAPGKTKGIKLRSDDANKRIQQVVNGGKQSKELRARIDAITSNIEDASVLAAARTAASHLDKTDALLRNFRAEAQAPLGAIQEANRTLSELT